jgi:hypothetical protein
LLPKAFPGKAKKLMLLTKVAKIDIPIAQEGRRPPPVVKSLAVRFRNEKETPKPITAARYIPKTRRSRVFRDILDL